MSPKKVQNAGSAATSGKRTGFTDEEREARELEASSADGEAAVLAKIAGMPERARS